MKVLLDMHIILRALENNSKLPEQAGEIIKEERKGFFGKMYGIGV